MDVIEGGAKSNRGKVCSGSPDSPAVKVLLRAWQEVDKVERDMLHKMTLADLLQRTQDDDKQTYHI
jgi:DNA-binding IscR family transcriptional regulator